MIGGRSCFEWAVMCGAGVRFWGSVTRAYQGLPGPTTAYRTATVHLLYAYREVTGNLPYGDCAAGGRWGRAEQNRARPIRSKSPTVLSSRAGPQERRVAALPVVILPQGLRAEASGRDMAFR